MPYFTGESDFKGIVLAPMPLSATVSIGGNAPQELKEMAVKWYDILHQKGSYVRSVRERLSITEVSLLSVPGEERGDQVKMVCEVNVEPGRG